MSNELTTQNSNGQLGFMAQAAASFEGVQKLSEIMAKCGTLPKHLQGQQSDCFRVVVQACKWGMDPFAVAECTSVVHGRLCFEGKLVAAVLTSMNAIEGRLEYEIEGQGQNASITVIGTPRGSKKPCSLGGTVKQWRTHTKKDGRDIPNAWDNQPETMLIYRGTRQWARVYAPEAVLGVYTPDEVEEVIKDAAVDAVDNVPAKKREPITPAEQPQQEASDEPQQEPPVDEAPVQHATADFDSSPVGKRERSMDLAKKLFGMGPAGKAALKQELEVAAIAKVQECPEDQLDDLIDGLQNQVDALGAK